MMNTYKLKYISAVIIYGTIGYILHFVNLPSEIVVLCRGVIGSLFIYLYLRVTKRNIDLVEAPIALKVPISFLSFNII